jgi:hypothetical protein
MFRAEATQCKEFAFNRFHDSSEAGELSIEGVCTTTMISLKTRAKSESGETLVIYERNASTIVLDPGLSIEILHRIQHTDNLTNNLHLSSLELFAKVVR